MSDTMIELKGFSFAYPNFKKQLKKVNFTVNRGDFVLLSGGTGTGKTTLLRSILGSDYITGTAKGKIEVGTDKIGYVAQEIESQLVCDTVWHEIAFGLENRGVEQSLMRRRVAEVSSFFNIDSWFRREISELSGGQKQLVNLCRALAVGPDLLLLDEPTSELDSVAEKNFLHALFRLNRELGMTIVVSTHSPQVMTEYANRLFNIENCHVEEIPIESQNSSARFFETHSECTPSIKRNTCVEVRDAYVRWSADADYVLRGLDCNFKEGTINAIVGGNGSGKSTLLLAVAEILKPRRGKVKNIFHCNQVYLPQHPSALFVTDTVFEELNEWQGSCGYADEEVEKALRTAGLSERRDVHPNDLSGGQKQLLALSKIMLTNPKLILLDEPTKGLDAHYRLQVAKMIKSQQQKGATVIFVTHDFEFAALVSDTISLVFDGSIAASESASDFFKKNLFLKPQKSAFFDICESTF